MTFLQPLGLLGLIGVPILILIYVLKRRYREETVPSTFLWRRSLAYMKRRFPWSLRNSVLLILQLIAVVLFSFMIARPTIPAPKTGEKIAVIDASAGMSAVGADGETRFSHALGLIDKFAQKADANHRVTIIVAGDVASYAVYRSDDKNEIRDAMKALSCGLGGCRLDDALALAERVQEENTEDIEKMAALMPSDKPYLKTSTLETYKARIPWLLLLMISATFTGQIISSFESALAAATVLTAYIPMLMDTGGNCGSQASVTVIRGLSLSEIEFSDIFRVIWKEIRVAVVCGVTLAAANFIKLMLVDRLIFHNPITFPVAAVICCTMVCTVLCAKVVGCALTLLAKKIGFDPAVMASPFITTIVDAISLLIYFQFATMILGI